MEIYLNTPIKEVISKFPKIGEILEEYEIGCVPCSVGSCLLKDIIEIHNLSEEDEILYPWMDRNLSVKEVGELFSKFNEVDEISGNGVTERCKAFVVKVEEKIQTPKKEVRP